MIRDLVENAILLVKRQLKQDNQETAEARCEDSLLDLLCGATPTRPTAATTGKSKTPVPEAGTETHEPKSLHEGLEMFVNALAQSSNLAGTANTQSDKPADAGNTEHGSSAPNEKSTDEISDTNQLGVNDHTSAGQDKSVDSDETRQTTGERVRQKMREKLRAGQLEERVVEFRVEQKGTPMMFGPMGGDGMDRDMQSLLEKMIPKSSKTKKLKVCDARKLLFEQEFEKLLDEDQVHAQAIDLAENLGIIFLDEIDKLVASDARGADVSRQGVQRDLLPLVEGTIVSTRYGQIKTDHILFIAAGAFHKNQPSDLMPELQGRFPILVELSNLTEDDYVRILSEPSTSLIHQSVQLMLTEGVRLEFSVDAVRSIARHAFQLNQTMQNIGARRLHTLLERILEDISYNAPDRNGESIKVDAAYIDERLKDLTADQDLSRFIL